MTPDDAVGGGGFGETSGLAVCGHMHVQLDRRVGDFRLVNAGSVGWLYEGRPGAFWAPLGTPCGSEPQGRGVAFVEAAYDVRVAAAEIRATAAPTAGELAAVLVSPPDPDEMTAIIEGQRGA